MLLTEANLLLVSFIICKILFDFIKSVEGNKHEIKPQISVIVFFVTVVNSLLFFGSFITIFDE